MDNQRLLDTDIDMSRRLELRPWVPILIVYFISGAIIVLVVALTCRGLDYCKRVQDA